MFPKRHEPLECSVVTPPIKEKPDCHNCQDRGYVDVEPGQKISNEPGEHPLSQTTDKTRASLQPCSSCHPKEYEDFWRADEAQRQLWFPRS